MIAICLALIDDEDDRHVFERLYEKLNKTVYFTALRITDTKEEDTNTHAAAVAISQDLIASTQEMAQEQQQIIEENIAKKDEKLKIKNQLFKKLPRKFKILIN